MLYDGKRMHCAPAFSSFLGISKVLVSSAGSGRGTAVRAAHAHGDPGPGRREAKIPSTFGSQVTTMSPRHESLEAPQEFRT